MRYGSVCSGIEAATSAWHVLGWKPVFFSEIEPFPSAVLKHHYPHVPNHGDMTKFKEWPDDPIDLLVGGTPCQSFSVAGLRKGLADPRGNLMLTYLALAEHYSPRWLVWENVPGVLSSNGGRDFGTFLGALEELGYGWAYRVLDAQYFGVAQRRRRVFVVGCLGDWRRAAAVLFERHSLSGHPAPRREKGKVTPCLSSSGTGVSRVGFNSESEWFVESRGQDPVVSDYYRATGRCGFHEDDKAEALRAVMHKQTDVDLICMAHGQANAEICSERRTALTCNHEAPIAVYPINTMAAIGRENEKNQRQTFGIGADGDPQFTLQNAHGHAVAFNTVAPSLTASNDPSRSPQSSEVTQQVNAVYQSSMQVRRLTPVECERLQGFPDNHTKIPWRNKPAEDCPDGPRYKALGNSMAVPVMRWIGKQIQMVEELSK